MHCGAACGRCVGTLAWTTECLETGHTSKQRLWRWPASYSDLIERQRRPTSCAAQTIQHHLAFASSRAVAKRLALDNARHQDRIRFAQVVSTRELAVPACLRFTSFPAWRKATPLSPQRSSANTVRWCFDLRALSPVGRWPVGPPAAAVGRAL